MYSVKSIDRKSVLWEYLSEELRGLLSDGEILLNHAEVYEGKISDFSYLVFPFSKAYEGFLKKLFLDLDLMREDEYYGDDIRIGRILNPHYIDDHYKKYKNICLRPGTNEDLSVRLWEVWRKGRNQVFHYFPHNFRRLSFDEASEIISSILSVMEESVRSCIIPK